MRNKFACGCAVTIREIAGRATLLAGHRVSDQTVRRVRTRMAQLHLDSAFAAANDGAGGWESGCIRNPYLPNRQIGNSHIFKARAAAKILRAVLAFASKSHHDRAVRRYKRAREAARVCTV